MIADLQASDHAVIMITGDAALTGIHVAAETDIISRDRGRTLVLTIVEDGKGVRVRVQLIGHARTNM